MLINRGFLGYFEYLGIKWKTYLTNWMKSTIISENVKV
jgi:hypothetical protein